MLAGLPVHVYLVDCEAPDDSFLALRMHLSHGHQSYTALTNGLSSNIRPKGEAASLTCLLRWRGGGAAA